MGSSSSSSQAVQKSVTNSTDKRIVNDSGIVSQGSALDFSNHVDTDVTSFDMSNRSTDNSNHFSSNFNDSSDRSTAISSWDSSVRNTSSNTNTNTGSFNTTVDPLIAKAAFDFASNNDARNGEGFDKLLSFASELTGKTQDSATGLASRFQDSVMQAFDSGRNTTPGGIDNKTMIILGVAGVAAVAMMASKKGS